MTPEQIDEIALTVAEGLFPCSITVPIDGQRKIIEFARRLVAEIQARNEPVWYEYQDREGRWRPFVDQRHFDATVKDGTWPIRKLYTFPPDCEELRKECEEQARLNGMGAAREAALSARLADAQRKLEIREQECEELRKDAGRYRKLRSMCWADNGLCVVRSEDALIGTNCFTGERLDEKLDTIAKEKAK